MTHIKLISTKTETMPFRPKFNEIVSPQIEPATESTVAIDQLLTDLGCLGDRPTSNAKVRVLLSSFLMQAQRLEGRVGPVTVWCRSFDSILCNKGDELWDEHGQMNSARMRCA
jgi:hypothetical protein